MSIELCILASGSSGNSAVLRAPGGLMLIDAGIGPRTAAKRLAGSGVTIGELSAICLTHLDRDHFSPTWTQTILQRGIRLFVHQQQVETLLRAALGGSGDGEDRDRLRRLISGFDVEPFQPLPELEMTPIALAHDAEGSHGFRIDAAGCRLGYATDLGRVPPALYDLFCGLDLLAIESNYDPAMQMASDRPWFLKQRIMGGRGHLSNEQAFEAVRRILDRCESAGRALPRHVVLLHRSRQCNCPTVIRTLFSRDARIASRLTLAEQHDRTPWLAARARRPLSGEQLSLAWG